jgi:hypothetical protein
MSDTGSDTGLPEEEHIASSGTLRGWHILLIVLTAVGLMAGWFWWSTRPKELPPEEPALPQVEVPEGSRTITLYFAADAEPALFAETRQVAMSKSTVSQVRQVMRALVAGPAGGRGANAIPQGTKLLGAYYDTETFTVYLDFSSELVAAHPGGTAAEYSTVAAIVRTVSENFPEVQAVQVLVEGYQVGTIAGHVDAYKPFRVTDWR